MISPSDPDGFVIPDLATLYVEIDRKNDLSDDDKRRERETAERDFRLRSERIPDNFPIAESIRIVRKR